MTRVGLSAEGLKGLMQTPSNREEAVRPQFEAVGFTLEHYFFAPGSGEAIAIIEGPDDASALDPLFIAIGAGGATVSGSSSFERIVTAAEFEDAARAAAQVAYRPPAE